MEFLRVWGRSLRDCSPHNWRTTWVWFFYTVVFGFMPIWIGVLILLGFRKHLGLSDFIVHGELVIYSATTVATSIRLISKDVDEGGPFVQRDIANLFAGTILALSVAVYSVIKATALLTTSVTINEFFIKVFSIPLVLMSLTFAFFVFLLDQQRGNPAVDTIVRHQQQDLERDFDSLGDTDKTGER